MFDEPFAQGDSPVHRLDPRVRLASAAFFSLCVALLHDPAAAAAALVMAAAALAASLPPASLLARRLAVVNAFILFLWATVPATMPGETLLVGDGAIRYADQLEGRAEVEVAGGDKAYPSARSLVQLAHARALREDWVRPQEIELLYLRRPDAEINWSTREGA